MSPPRRPSPDYDSYIVNPYPLPPDTPRPNEPPLVEIFEQNKDWFDRFMESQKHLAQARIEAKQKEIRQKQFKHVYRSEPRMPKPAK